jgi:hypothetical protein
LHEGGKDTRALAEAAGKQAGAAKLLADLMEEDQRPWISLDMHVVDAVTCVRGGCTTTISYSVANVGKSPARDVDFAPIMTHGPAGPTADTHQFADSKRNVDKAAEFACALMQPFQGKSGKVMLPGEREPEGAQIPPRFRVGTSQGGGIIEGEGAYVPTLVIVGCVTYRFLNDPKVHRTVRVFQLGKPSYNLFNLNADGPIQPGDLLEYTHTGGALSD